ncbi:MAG: PDZ domain-containing protein [Desulfuromonadales bacterium]
MKRLNFIANPIFLLLIIISFVYVYFFYLADGPARKKEAAETEPEIARPIAPPAHNPNAAANVAGIIMKEENPFNMGKDPGQMNVPNGGQFFDQQNRQHPLTMQEENPFAQRTRKPRLSKQPDPNVQPAQFQTPYGFYDQNVVPVAGGALGKTWIEAHWIGLEAGPLVPAVAKANNIPTDVTGVFVDEVTLVAADSGLLAGDVITAVNGNHVADLKSFKNATKQVAQTNQTQVTVYRRGTYKNITVTSPEELGFAQIEGAPMILATDRAPHGNYGPCDKCHTIAPGRTNLNQMAKDLGDILAKTAPNIRKGTPAPHSNRGACSKCHVLL